MVGTSTNSQTWILVPTASRGHSHRRPEGAEVCVEVVPLLADEHDLAGPVGRDQERGPQPAQERREIGRMDGAERLGPFRGGRPVALVIAFVNDCWSVYVRKLLARRLNRFRHEFH